MDTEKLFKKIMKRIRTGELIIQSVDEINMDRDVREIGINSEGIMINETGAVHLEIKLTVIPKVKNVL